MKFSLIVEELLNELSGDEIYQKYYNNIPEKRFKTIIAYDPQSKLDNGRIIRIGKYSKILLNLFSKDLLRWEDLQKAREYLTYVYKYHIPLENNNIRSLADIYELIKKYIVKDTKQLPEILKSLSPKEYKILHDGEEWYIFQPLDEKSAAYIGSNTQWCTTWGEFSLNSSNKDRSCRFNEYNKQGPLYIIINKSNPNEKYQFHFESDQHMNSSDREINVPDFFKNNPEVKIFFFPSFVRQVTAEERDFEFHHIDLLSPEDSSIIIKNSLSNEDLKNPLIHAITTNNFKLINKLINDDELESEVVVGTGSVIFDYKKLPWEIESVYDTLASYQREKGEFSANIEMTDDEAARTLEPYFIEYYKDRNEDLKKELGIINYEEFYAIFFKDFYESEDVIDNFITETEELTTPNFEEKVDTEINNIKKYIDFQYRYHGISVYLKTTFFILYLSENNIEFIKDNLNEIIIGYIEKYNVSTEYEGIYDYETVYPDPKKTGTFMTYLDEYFDKYIYDSDVTKEYIEKKKRLSLVIEKLFHGKLEFNNDHVYVRILSTEVDMDNGTVMIEYKNKDTGKTFKGNVKVDNLSNYVTNYQLFENLISFNKNIL